MLSLVACTENRRNSRFSMSGSCPEFPWDGTLPVPPACEGRKGPQLDWYDTSH